MIREFELEDAEGVSAALHDQEIPGPVTAEGVIHWHAAQPERARACSWVAEEAGRIVGWGRARRRWSTTVEDVADVWAYVVPTMRARGFGAALFRAAETHARDLGARKLHSWSEGDAGNAFLETRSFRVTGHQRISSLDPATAPLSELDRLEAERAAEGFRLAQLAEVRGRVQDLHRVYAAASADVPQDFREDDVRLDEWRLETLEHPQLSGEGSHVVLAGDQLAALAFVELDEPAGLAASEMTGTLPEFRRRGLARLAKLATIRWASKEGISALVTANDESNLAMLGLNESLGYRPLYRETLYRRDE